jgi:enamine deaminase RidA (YjgF/YER057c/UK114 family)
MPIEYIKSGPRMSQAVIRGGTVYLAGQVALGAPAGKVAEQTKDILAKIDALLAEAGTDKSRLLTATIWLTDMATFAEDERCLGCMGGAGCDACARHRCEPPIGLSRLQR